MSTTIKSTALVAVIAGLAFFALGVAQASAQIVQNGSFEDPGVTDDANWEVHVTSNVPGWTIEWMDPTAMNGKPNDANLEFHRGVNNWGSDDGDQHVELDTDWDGPGGNINGEAASARISQEVETEARCTYELSFAFSPRPGTGSDNNELGIVWNGSDVDEISADGTGNNDTEWTTHTYQVTGGGLDTLAFEDRGTGDSLGTFLDDVSLEKISCPEVKTRGDDDVRNYNKAVVINKTEASASTGGNYAGGSEGGDGGNGGDIENEGGYEQEGGSQDVDDSSTGSGGNGGNGGAGGFIDTGDATASAGTVNTVNTNVTRIDRCACSGDDKGDVDVRNRNRAFLYNETDADAKTGHNAAKGSEGGDGGNGGEIENDYGEQDVDDTNTGSGGRGGSGSQGGTIFTGNAGAYALTVNDINRNTTRIRR